VVVFSGLVLMVALWWLYFEHSDKHAGVRPKNLFIFLHAHGLLFCSLILLSVGYRTILEVERAPAAFWLIAGGTISMLVAILLIRSMLHTISTTTLLKVGVLFALGIGTLWAGYFYGETVTMLAGISLLFTIAALLDHFGAFSKPPVLSPDTP
jgi:low temperature requirement protein LtrA